MSRPTSASSNEEKARKLIQKWQDQTMVLVDMFTRENATEIGLNPMEVEQTIRELSEFIVSIHVIVAHAQTVEEMDGELNEINAELQKEKWKLLDTYEIQPPQEQIMISKTVRIINTKLEMLRIFLVEFNKLLPGKPKPHEPSPLMQFLERVSHKPSATTDLPNSFPPYEALGGSKRRKSRNKRNKRKSRKSTKSRKSRFQRSVR